MGKDLNKRRGAMQPGRFIRYSRNWLFWMVVSHFAFPMLPGLAPNAGAAPHVVGSVKLQGLPHATFVTNNKVYVARVSGGVDIVTVKNPKSPRIVGMIDTDGNGVEAVFVVGNLAYVANNGSNGFRIFNVADPKSPKQVGSLGEHLTPFRADDVFVQGHFAYIAAGTSYSGETGRLHIVDIEDPTKPSVVGSAETPIGADMVVVSGEYAFVGGSEHTMAGTGHLWVIALSDPANPEIVTSLQTTGSIADLAVAGRYLYVVDESGVLQLIDVNDPRNPVAVGSLTDLLHPQSISVVGSYAYLADTNGFHTVDLGNPETPRVAHTLGTLNAPKGVSAADQYAYVIGGGSETTLKVVAISDRRQPRPAGSLELPGYAEDVFAAGSYAHVAAGNEGVQVVDVTDPNSPLLAGALETPGWASDVKVAGSYASVVDDSYVHVVNMSSPSSPTIVNSVPTSGYVDKAFLAGSYAYVIGTSWGLGVVDISNPTTPVLVGQVPIPAGSLWDLYVSGNHAYVATFAGLFVVDVSVPHAPTIVSRFKKASNFVGVSGVGSYVYLTDGGKFYVLDVTDPTSLTVVGSLQEYSERLYALGSFVYAKTWDGLAVIEVSDPARPVVVGTLEIDMFIDALHASGHYAYLVGREGSMKSVLQIVDISDYTIKEKGIVAGTLKVDGAALAGIRTKLYRKEGPKWACYSSKKTDKAGAYTFKELPPGNYYLDLLNLPAGNVVAGSITVEGSPFVSGRVNLFVKTGAAWAKKASKKPNAAGAFQFPGLSAGTYRLKALTLELLGKPVL